MDANPSGLGGRERDSDQEALVREIASLRTYLLFVAGTLAGVGPLASRGASDLVDSVLADAFAKVRRGGDGFTFRSDAELRAWLVNRLRWRCSDRLRRRRRYQEMLAGLRPGRPPMSPSGDAARGEQARLLAEAMARLDPADRQLIEWYLDEGVPFREIGRRRGCSTSYARRAYLAAMTRLGAICRDLGGTDGDAPGAGPIPRPR